MKAFVYQPLPLVVVLVLVSVGLVSAAALDDARSADIGRVAPAPAVVPPTAIPTDAVAAPSVTTLQPAAAPTIVTELPEDTRAEQPEESAETLLATVPDTAPQEPGRSVLHRVCRVTAYCDRGITASGTQSGVGQCAAPGYIPFGTTVYIPELNRTFVVTDRTHRRFRQSTVDIFIPSQQACKDFGCRFTNVEFYLPAESD